MNKNNWKNLVESASRLNEDLTSPPGDHLRPVMHDYDALTTSARGRGIQPRPTRTGKLKPDEDEFDPPFRYYPPYPHMFMYRLFRRFLEAANVVGEFYNWGQHCFMGMCFSQSGSNPIVWSAGPFYAIDGQEYYYDIQWGQAVGGIGVDSIHTDSQGERTGWAASTRLTGEDGNPFIDNPNWWIDWPYWFEDCEDSSCAACQWLPNHPQCGGVPPDIGGGGGFG